jgi:hypothetical protein
MPKIARGLLMATIDWSGFSWEAFSTLVTGLAAVAAATFVGRRQTGIAAKQTTILDRQVALEELKLRSELFDRRFAIYEATHAFISEASFGDNEVTRQTYDRFKRATDQSIFLFDINIWQSLVEIHQRYRKLEEVESLLKGRTSDWPFWMEITKLRNDLIMDFHEQRLTLNILFGDELSLGGTQFSKLADLVREPIVPREKAELDD